MIRKLTLALAATVAVGSAALVPSAANATWYGNGWYGKGWYGYGHYNKYYPGYAYGHRYFYKPYVYSYGFKPYKRFGWKYRYGYY